MFLVMPNNFARAHDQPTELQPQGGHLWELSRTEPNILVFESKHLFGHFSQMTDHQSVIYDRCHVVRLFVFQCGRAEQPLPWNFPALRPAKGGHHNDCAKASVALACMIETDEDDDDD